MHRFVPSLLFLLVAGAASVPAARAQHGHGAAGASPVRLDQAAWRADLATLAAELRRVHPDPFARIAEARFDSAVAALDARLGQMDDRAAALGMMAITSLIEDGHTGAIGLLGHLGFDAWFPLRTVVQDGALYVVAAAPAHRTLVGGRVTRLGDLDGPAALARVLTITAGDNAFSRSDHVPLLLMSPGVLQGLGIQRDGGPLRVEVEHTPAPGGRARRVGASLTAIPSQGPPAFMQDPFGVPGEGRATLIDRVEPLPLHLRDPERAWGYSWRPAAKLLYFHFRRVDREDGGRTFASFVDDMFAFADSAGAEYMAIDLRHNGGGDNSIVQPLIHALIRRHQTVNRPGRLFTIIGRTTFSAAMNTANWLEEHTATRFVGEPTGGRPNHFGDATTIVLPNSRMPVRISRYPWTARWPWDGRPWIAPQMPAPPDVAALAAGRDPAMEAIEWAIEHGPLEERLEAALVAERGAEARAIYAADRARFPDRWGRDRIRDMAGFSEALLQAGHPAAALELARIQTETYPDAADTWAWLGVGFVLAGEREEAIEALQKALALDPEHRRARFWMERARGE